MAQQIEEAIRTAQAAQQHYQTLLSTPLPPSPLLADTHHDILENEVGVAVGLLWKRVYCCTSVILV